jgi:multiple sugar transport system substrate-binding protein
MFSTGSFGVSTFHQDAPHLKWNVTPIPGRHGGSSSFAGGDEIAITRSSSHQAAAWEFVKWATSAPVQEKYFGDQGVIPIHRDVTARAYATRSAAFRALTHALFTGRVVYSVQENALINDSTGPWATMLGRAWSEARSAPRSRRRSRSRPTSSAGVDGWPSTPPRSPAAAPSPGCCSSAPRC